VQALLRPLADRVRLNCPVASVTRHEDHVVVRPESGEAEVFDQVVFAAHADQVLRILRDADPLERETLAAFPYQQNQAVLHTDIRWLPRRQRAWASWNYQIPRQADRPVTVTYNLSRLQRVGSPAPILLTLNPNHEIDSRYVLRQFRFDHPAYSLQSPAAQHRHQEVNGRRRTWYCGAYWGYGFHEDGVNSALTVAKAFGKSLDTCTVVSTKAACGIGVTSR
jgi:predicted NAD/FAD-binding protein